MVSGGEHHTIALTKSGRVYCWGRNDEGECGVGDLFGKYRREQAILEQQKLEEAEKKAKDDAEKAAADAAVAATSGIEESKPAEDGTTTDAAATVSA